MVMYVLSEEDAFRILDDSDAEKLLEHLKQENKTYKEDNRWYATEEEENSFRAFHYSIIVNDSGARVFGPHGYSQKFSSLKEALNALPYQRFFTLRTSLGWLLLDCDGTVADMSPQKYEDVAIQYLSIIRDKGG